MRDVFSKIKYQVSCSETSLRRANKHWLTIKMAIQLQEKQNPFYQLTEKRTRLQRNLLKSISTAEYYTKQ